MNNLETVLQTIETLSNDELDKVYQFIRQRRQTITWTITKDSLNQIQKEFKAVNREAQEMSEQEIDELIDNEF